MKKAGIAQGVIILLLIASAASCEVGKEYANRVFTSRPEKKSELAKVKFMQLDSSVATGTIDITKIENNEIKDSIKTDVVAVEIRKVPGDMTSGTPRTKKVRQ